MSNTAATATPTAAAAATAAALATNDPEPTAAALEDTLRADDLAFAEELAAALVAFQETVYLTYPDGTLDAAAALILAEIAGFLPPHPDTD